MTGNIWTFRAARRLERRVFLKALALGCSIPMAWKLSGMALAQPTARPKRFMLFYIPHGMPPEHFNPVVNPQNPADFTFNQSGVSVLGPLEEKYKGLTNIVQGFRYPSADTHGGICTFLSGLDGKGDTTTKRTTVEHQIANALGVKPLVLGAVAQEQWQVDIKHMLLWDSQHVVPEKNPMKAYDQIFAGIGAAPTGPSPDVELRAALSTLTEQQLAGMQTEVTSLTSERNKLQIHIESLQALDPSSGGGQVSCTTKPAIAAVEAVRAKAQGQSTEPGNDFFLKFENFKDILAAQLGIAAHALLCNAAQVVAVQSLFAPCEIDLGVPGSPGAYHNDLSHTQPQGNQAGTGLDMSKRVPFATAQRWFFEQLVQHVLTVLDQPDPSDPAHKAIDNTLIYVCSEIGEGAWHNFETQMVNPGPFMGPMAYVPAITIGGGGGALKTGQVVKFAADRPAGDMYLALCRAMGVMGGSFGTAASPVTEILT